MLSFVTYLIIKGLMQSTVNGNFVRSLVVAGFGAFTFYLCINMLVHVMSLQNLEDRMTVLNEFLDSANERVFHKYSMKWESGEYGLWLTCEIGNPNCKKIQKFQFF